jgi:hypothetical protein
VSHTTKAAHGTTFIHDGGYSGNVQIVVPAPLMPARIEVPFADLRELVFGYLRGRRIERSEQVTDDEFERGLLL